MNWEADYRDKLMYMYIGMSDGDFSREATLLFGQGTGQQMKSECCEEGEHWT